LLQADHTFYIYGNACPIGGWQWFVEAESLVVNPEFGEVRVYRIFCDL